MSYTEFMEEYLFRSLSFIKAASVYSELLEIVQGIKLPEQAEINQLKTINNLYNGD